MDFNVFDLEHFLNEENDLEIEIIDTSDIIDIVTREESITAEDSEDETEKIRKFIKSGKNKNTDKKNHESRRKFNTFLKDNNELRPMEEIPSEELDKKLAEFLMKLMKKGENGETFYEPDTYTSVHRGIKRCLEDSGYEEDLLKSSKFRLSREVLRTQRKLAKGSGLGNRKNKAEPITDAEEQIMWEVGELGHHNPQALLNTMWWFCGKMLGFRGSHEHRQMTWGDLTLDKDDLGRECLVFTERFTKTRTGVASNSREWEPKLFKNSNNLGRCPVQTYHEFAKRRPEETKLPQTPFYLGINSNPKEKQVWFKNQALGENKLGKMMRTMAGKAGLSGKKTNHSIRHTTITKLAQSGVAPTQVAQLTGHKNIASLNKYSSATVTQQRQMAELLMQNDYENHGIVEVATPTAIHRQPLLPLSNSDNDNSGYSNSNSLQQQIPTMPSIPSSISGLFSGATINGGTFNINLNMNNPT